MLASDAINGPFNSLAKKEGSFYQDFVFKDSELLLRYGHGILWEISDHRTERSLVAHANSYKRTKYKDCRNKMGVLFDKDGNIQFEGAWLDDRREGEGVYYFRRDKSSPIDMIIRGFWVKDELVFGNYRTENGNFYVGEMKQENGHSAPIPEGSGEVSYANGDYFIGKWKNSEPIYGKMIYNATGDIFDGEWKNGMFSGFGVMMCSNGNRYEGMWERGVPHGTGRALFKCFILNYSDDYELEENSEEKLGDNEDTISKAKHVIHYTGQFIGEFRNGERNGQGHMVLNNKDEYYGQWEADLPHGPGIYLRASDGSEFFGQWDRGVMINNSEKKCV